MAYRLSKNKSVEKSVRKIALEQIDKAIGEIKDKNLDHHEKVHQVRKRCKKLRALIRLVRPKFKDYSIENAVLRDAARQLSFIRDAQSIIESLDRLSEHFQPHIDNKVFTSIRKELIARRKHFVENKGDLDQELEQFHAEMKEIRRRCRKWQIEGTNFTSIAGGLRKTYRRGRKALDKACETPTTENFHEWRKRVKYHWYQSRLLRQIWPGMMRARRTTANDLANLLGDDHDMAILGETLRDDFKDFSGKNRLEEIFGLIERRRRELQNAARPLGEWLYAENGKQLTKRYSSYWSTWKNY